jgi:hypothetical protein
MAARRHRLPSLLDNLVPSALQSAASEAAVPQAAMRAHHPHHSRRRILVADVRRVPSIARVCRHLNCELIRLHAAGEPACVFLGRDIGLRNEKRGVRASPQFRTVEALEYFCATHLAAFLAIGAMPRLARDWFWNR